ncbi:HmuY family protein [Paraglaciecola sp. 20A4]|uniref:HmuY family protein n=1 Tax=Paraglaciecola sp. 20A4 TaxID=2687288 RepID=UPI00140878DE|nr:HmuY family protein [Paraglaciecola sp. 20A4]
MKISYLASLSTVLLLTACGGSSSTDSSATPSPTESTTPVVEQGTVVGPFSTGTTAEPTSVYFDLDAGEVLVLTDEEAAENSAWDIAFQRTKVYLNTHVDNAVGAFFTDVNSEFYDETGAAVVDSFLNADADSELDDYLGISAADIPEEDSFIGDSEESVIGAKFYDYDITTHVVSANDDRYFIVDSDSMYSKFRVIDLTSDGRTMSSITFGVAIQNTLAGDTEFGAESALTINTANCTDDIYIDFDLGAALSASDAWDITLPCTTVDDITGAEFDIHIAVDAQALVDEDNTYATIDSEAAQYYGFTSDVTQELAFDKNSWYQYNLNGGHLLWSQYGVYLIKTSDATFKMQITSYYDEAGTSGNYSFRFDELISE